MSRRISTVNNLKVDSMLIGGMLQVGDCVVLKPESNVLAISRQLPIFWGNEGELSAYPAFTKIIPMPVITEKLEMNIENEVPIIKVGNLYIIGISTSGCVQIGSNQRVETSTRVKHFRQFIFQPETPPRST